MSIYISFSVNPPKYQQWYMITQYPNIRCIIEERTNCDYDKQSIYLVICDTDTQQLAKS
jgi:hypothetical protein